jgi:hypothetical protein
MAVAKTMPRYTTGSDRQVQWPRRRLPRSQRAALGPRTTGKPWTTAANDGQLIAQVSTRSRVFAQVVRSPGLSVAGGSYLGLGPRWVRVAGSRTGITGHQRLPTVQRTRGRRPFSSRNCDAASGRFGLWPRRSGRRRPGSRWAATSVRNDRGTPLETVEDHDRRYCHQRPLTWHFSPVFPGPQHHAVPSSKAQCRSRTEEARGSNPLTSTPQTDPMSRSPLRSTRHWSPGMPCASVGPIEPVGGQLKTRQPRGPVNLAAALRRPARDPTRPPGHSRDQPRMKRTSRQNAGALAASVREPTSTQR